MKDYMGQALAFLNGPSPDIETISAARTDLETRHFRSEHLYRTSLYEVSERLNEMHSRDGRHEEGDPLFDIRARIDYLQSLQRELDRVRHLIGIFDSWILYEQTREVFSPVDQEQGKNGLESALWAETCEKLGERPKNSLVESISGFLRQGNDLEAITELIIPVRSGQGNHSSKGHDR